MSYEVTTTSARPRGGGQRGARAAVAAVVQVDAQRRREPLDLGDPLPHDAHRADDERRPERRRRRAPRARTRAARSPAPSCRGPCRRRGSRPRRGRRAAAASRGRAPGTERAGAASRRASAASGTAGRPRRAARRAAGRASPRRARGPPRRSRRRRRRGRGRRGRRPRAGARGSAAPARPPSGGAHASVRRRGGTAPSRGASAASSSSPSSTSPSATRHSKRASASVERRPLERARLVAFRSTRSRLGERIQSAGRSTGTPRSASCGIASRRKRPAASTSSTVAVAPVGVEPDAARCEQRLDRRELPGEVAARVAGAHEREDLVAALVQQRRGQAQRRVVLRVQPQLEREPVGAARLPVVEVAARASSGPAAAARARRRPSARAVARAARSRCGAGAAGPGAASPSRNDSSAAGRIRRPSPARRTPLARRRSRAIWSVTTA